MISWFFNLIVPGAGLIFHRREWLGFVLSILFGVFANVALAGRFIVPEALPAWVVQLSIILVALTWLCAQIMLGVHVVQLRRRREVLAAILEQARQALEAGNVSAAQSSLEDGFLVDDEIIELHVLWARLCAMQGNRPGQEEAWKRVLQLDLHCEYRDEAMQILQTGL